MCFFEVNAVQKSFKKIAAFFLHHVEPEWRVGLKSFKNPTGVRLEVRNSKTLLEKMPGEKDIR